MNREWYEFNPKDSYKLTAVKDLEGHNKVSSRKLYIDRIHCIATAFRYDEYPEYGNRRRLYMDFIRTADGLLCHRRLHTSFVQYVEETENGVNIHTTNSVYVFENAELNEVAYCDAENTLEIYMAMEDNEFGGMGFFYSSEGTPHALTKTVFSGMFQDSVYLTVENFPDFVCQYFPLEDHVEFYRVLYDKKECDFPVLIHNTGKYDFNISFPYYPNHMFTVKAGESKYIMPYRIKEMKGNDENGRN